LFFLAGRMIKLNESFFNERYTFTSSPKNLILRDDSILRPNLALTITRYIIICFCNVITTSCNVIMAIGYAIADKRNIITFICNVITDTCKVITQPYNDLHSDYYVIICGNY
jgi:hypothetical protein